MPAPFKLAVLVSGRGSNLRALMDAIDGGTCGAEIMGVLSDRAGAPALEFAAARGVATDVISPKSFADRAAWDEALAQRALAFAPDLVVLAGFMRLVGPAMLRHFEGRIVNVHPALLPSFPGMDGPAQALRAGVTITGCTVHLVDAGIDSGPILAQAAVPVRTNDDVASLHGRIQVAEHRLFPAVIDAIATGKITLSPKPRYTGEYPQDGASLVAPPVLPDG